MDQRFDRQLTQRRLILKHGGQWRVVIRTRIDIIEAGNPGSNPKDIEFFDRLQSVPLTHARLCAFGSTRRPGIIPENDANLERIIQARTPVAAIFGKSSKFHVEKILRTTPEENLAMIEDSVAYLTKQGIEVIFDAEHFFDGYKEDPEYALSSLEAAKRRANWPSDTPLCSQKRRMSSR